MEGIAIWEYQMATDNRITDPIIVLADEARALMRRGWTVDMIQPSILGLNGRRYGLPAADVERMVEDVWRREREPAPEPAPAPARATDGAGPPETTSAPAGGSDGPPWFCDDTPDGMADALAKVGWQVGKGERGGGRFHRPDGGEWRPCDADGLALMMEEVAAVCRRKDRPADRYRFGARLEERLIAVVAARTLVEEPGSLVYQAVRTYLDGRPNGKLTPWQMIEGAEVSHTWESPARVPKHVYRDAIQAARDLGWTGPQSVRVKGEPRSGYYVGPGGEPARVTLRAV